MIVSVPKESAAGEHRVSVTPDVAKRLANQGIEVRVEAGAGELAAYPDTAYADVGATVTADAGGIWSEADIVVTVQKPTSEQLGRIKSGALLIGVLQPLIDHDLVRAMANQKITSMSLDAVPRISRAQSMDILSSQATVAGYKAVLIAASNLLKFFPMFVTAAGTIPPGKVLVIGAGVAGLQAIATAKRLGARVEAFDVRPAVKEQVESLGAVFVSPDAEVSAEGEGGYAKAQSEDQAQRTVDFLHERAKGVDVIITTAQIPGKPAPLLIPEATVKDMRPGAVIVDLASESGGNCELSEHGETVVRHGVTIIGPANLASSMATDASQMFARNVLSFLGEFVKDGQISLDFENEVISGSCITHDGHVVHERTRQAMGEE